MMVTVARRPKETMKLMLIRPPIIMITVEIKIIATDANIVLPKYSSLQN